MESRQGPDAERIVRHLAIHQSVFATGVIALIRLYQMVISPWLGPCCRFYPSCSDYAQACFAQWPVHRALYYTVRRLAKCHPGHCGGWDPVPARHPLGLENQHHCQ